MTRQVIRTVRDLTNFSLSPMTAMKNQSSSEHPVTRVILPMETSGEFSPNLARVLNATGMSKEELYAFLTGAAGQLHTDESIPLLPMMNDKHPNSEHAEVLNLIIDFIDELAAKVSRLMDQIGDFKLLEVLEDDAAFVEYTPPHYTLDDLRKIERSRLIRNQ